MADADPEENKDVSEAPPEVPCPLVRVSLSAMGVSPLIVSILGYSEKESCIKLALYGFLDFTVLASILPSESALRRAWVMWVRGCDCTILLGHWAGTSLGVDGDACDSRVMYHADIPGPLFFGWSGTVCIR